MTEKLDLEQRVDLNEARIGIITKALSEMIHELGNIDQVELVNQDRPWTPEKINWKEANGASGPYEKATDGVDYHLLVKDLKSSDGKFRKGGFFYWLFQRGDAVGRKKV